MNGLRTYTLTLPSERSSITGVEPFLQNIEACHRLSPDRYHNLLVALTEAVNNAIIHGNNSDPSKPVNIDVQTSGHEIIILVSDKGSGFDPDAVPDPRDPDRLLREGGRGVFLIRHLADVVEFASGPEGMTVLIKYFLA
ncbi:MAG: hypothetical protein BGO89_09985 [Candidatus Kapaibacterium thiocyanatum]|uniref:Histidine kinase/HSP90-like ATPase domain-containing protein n=1 Tax=Candidatus Kapaibacterium thiocyanatum TaxID=1895771 RepID=A0A1M3KWR5_9BACT|nr:MAG: hypothetical protein BGO89_09985 ['Candidatus Kapabacteria' thiocyanatum]